MTGSDRIATTHRMIELYNAQDADSYVALMTEDACEAGYRGAVLREGKEGVREGLKAMWAQFPQNRAEILSRIRIGPWTIDEERVTGRDGPPLHAVAIYEVSDGRIRSVRFLSERD